MTSLRWFGAGLGLLVLLAGGTLYFLTGSSPAQRAFERIEIGMTLPQVEAAIGLPPGNYATSERSQNVPETHIYDERLQPDRLPPGTTIQTWFWDDYWVWVAFDAQGKVARRELLPRASAAPPRG